MMIPDSPPQPCVRAGRSWSFFIPESDTHARTPARLLLSAAGEFFKREAFIKKVAAGSRNKPACTERVS
eukprot:scaffold16950_cov54-Attheya_sp.AAC.2